MIIRGLTPHLRGELSLHNLVKSGVTCTKFDNTLTNNGREQAERPKQQFVFSQLNSLKGMLGFSTHYVRKP